MVVIAVISFENLKQFINAIMAKRKKPDWEQCDSSQEDYIKNRPFYDEMHTVKFTDKSAYDEPVADAEGQKFYKISDKLVDFKHFDNADEIFIKIETTDGVQEIKVPLIKSNDELSEIEEKYFLGCYSDFSGEFIEDKNTELELTMIAGQTTEAPDADNYPCFAILFKQMETEFETAENTILQPGMYDVKVYNEETDSWYPNAKPLQITTHKYHKLSEKYLPTVSINENKIQNMIDKSVGSVLGGAS